MKKLIMLSFILFAQNALAFPPASELKALRDDAVMKEEVKKALETQKCQRQWKRDLNDALKFDAEKGYCWKTLDDYGCENYYNGLNTPFINQVISELKSQGYTVKPKKDFNNRDYMTIYWCQEDK